MFHCYPLHTPKGHWSHAASVVTCPAAHISAAPWRVAETIIRQTNDQVQEHKDSRPASGYGARFTNLQDNLLASEMWSVDVPPSLPVSVRDIRGMDRLPSSCYQPHVMSTSLSISMQAPTPVAQRNVLVSQNRFSESEVSMWWIVNSAVGLSLGLGATPNGTGASMRFRDNPSQLIETWSRTVASDLNRCTVKVSSSIRNACCVSHIIPMLHILYRPQ